MKQIVHFFIYGAFVDIRNRYRRFQFQQVCGVNLWISMTHAAFRFH